MNGSYALAARRRRRLAPAPVILAAGGSRRLGRPKQFLRLRGATLLAASVQKARYATDRRPWVITGARRFAVAAAAVRAGAHVMHNPRWQQGMGESLAVAARRLPFEPGLLVLTVDQFQVRGDDLRRLVRAWRRRPRRPAAALYRGHLGVPAILPLAWRSRLRRLRGDRGAREWLARSGLRVTRVRMTRAARDVDTQQDWR